MLKNYIKLIVVLVFATNVMAQNIPSYLPKEGLVGYWPFNGNANDESGNGNHGTVNGATLSSDRNGVANSAYNFDGVDDYIVTSNFLEVNENFTISLWVFNNHNLISNLICDANTDGGNDFLLNIETTRIGIRADKSGKTLNYENNSPIELMNLNIIKKWVNIIWKMENGNSYIYLNDKLIYNTNEKGSNLNYHENGISFGARKVWNNFDNFLKGSLDDISIYNRALSDQEVQQLYAGCTKETATSSNFNSVIYTTTAALNLNANPSGGTFSGDAVVNNSFNPSKAKLGKNTVKYNFKNTTGCADSTNFTMILVDTLGNKCSTYDTLKIKVKLTTGIKAGQQTSMNIYPNPTSDVLIIEANDIQALSGYKYKILDLQGKEVYNALATSAKTEISLKSIGAKGMYVLHIVDEKGVSIENKKIVLE